MFTISGQKNNTKLNKWKWRISHFTQNTQWILGAREEKTEWLTLWTQHQTLSWKNSHASPFPVECNSEEEKATLEADGMPGEKELMGLSLQITLCYGWTVAAEMYSI